MNFFFEFSKFYFKFTGLVERCHRTLQSVIVKVMEQQGDWYK